MRPNSFDLNIIFLHCALSVHLPIIPVPDLLPAVLPKEFSISMFLVIHVASFLYPSIWPSEHPMSVYTVILPTPFIDPAIIPLLLSLPFDVIIPEVPLLRRPIDPLEWTFPFLHSIVVSASLACAILPRLNPLTILFVILPGTNLFASIFGINVGPKAFRLVIQPFSSLFVTLVVFQLPNSSCLVIYPFPFLNGLICPINSTKPVFFIVAIDQSSLKGHCIFYYLFLIYHLIEC